jgi:hypothetical protein
MVGTTVPPYCSSWAVALYAIKRVSSIPNALSTNISAMLALWIVSIFLRGAVFVAERSARVFAVTEEVFALPLRAPNDG